MVSTPVALSVFNRPETTEQVFAAIARARPSQLFVFADGPRTEDEGARCEQARQVTQRVDWECDARYQFSPVNVGARRRYSSGVDWVFEQVDEAIVLDDDCVPDDSFFPFCEQMLEQYRGDERVMMVCGTNYLDRWKSDRQSYHFSRLGTVWGWATWKRAWSTYDVDMKGWSDPAVQERIREVLGDDEIFKIERRRFDRIAGEVDRHSWDLPWLFARLAAGGLTIVPSVNLVANLGNADGRGLPPEHPLSNLQARQMSFPLCPPPVVTADRPYDRLHVGATFDWWAARSRREDEAERRARALHRRVAGRIRRAMAGVAAGADGS
jgi:hypothetical protein